MEAAWGARRELGGDTTAQGFVRAQAIVFSAPAIQAALLGARIGRGRRGRFGFEHTVHLFVGAIVLGLGPPRKLDANSQTHPPQAQASQMEGSGTGKGSAVVDPDDAWQAAGFEYCCHDPAHTGLALFGHDAGAKHLATAQIANGQGITALAIRGPEPAFEVDRPDFMAALRTASERAEAPAGLGGCAAVAARSERPL